jgi:hypothetical protein
MKVPRLAGEGRYRADIVERRTQDAEAAEIAKCSVHAGAAEESMS